MQEKTLRFDEINFFSLLRTLIKNLWVIALLCASVVMCYTSASRLSYAPTYRSQATFMVSAKDSTSAYNSLTTTQSMASVFVEVFQSNVLREKVQQQMPDGKFDGHIHTTTIPETNLLIVYVTAPEPEMAYRGISGVIDNYESISDYLFANAQLEVIKNPEVPTVAINPLNVQSSYPLIVVITALLSVALITAIFLLRDTVQTPKAARRRIDARLLRTINHEQKNKSLRAKLQRKNAAPLICNALISRGYIEDNLSLGSAVAYHMRRHSQKVILVTSVGENEGKSTVAANLALAMARRNKKVVLVDCDFRKPSLNKIFEVNIPREQTLPYCLLRDGEDPARAVVELKRYGFSLCAGNGNTKSITKLLNSGKLERFLKQLRTEADCVILDTPPMLAAADVETIAPMADTALLVVRGDFMPAEQINNGLDRLRQCAPEVCGFVLNNHLTKVL